MSELNPKKEAPVQGMSGLGGGPTSLLCTAPLVIADPGQVEFTTTGSHTWTVPAGVTSVSVVCIGAGSANGMNGGGGGALAYGNNISVTPGSSISLQVGLKEVAVANTSSWFINSSTLQGGGANYKTGGTSSGSARTGGGDGGTGGTYSSWSSSRWGGGGGGAGGYNGNGGGGGGDTENSGYGIAGSSDAAGGGGMGSQTGSCNGGGGGGGSGLIGTTSSSTGGGGGDKTAAGAQGGDGQGNSNCNADEDGYCNGAYTRNGRTYGGGLGGVSSGQSCSNSYSAANGAVRIIWPGDTRTFPSACADV